MYNIRIGREIEKKSIRFPFNSILIAFEKVCRVHITDIPLLFHLRDRKQEYPLGI